MHEYALADAVLRAAAAAADGERLSVVTAIRVRVGELQQIDPDVFSFALERTRPEGDARFAATRTSVEVVPARFRCRACSREFSLSDVPDRDADAAEAIHLLPEAAHAFLACPGCGSPDFEVAAGRGVEIASIEGERSGA